MIETIEQRACELAVYIIETGATVRSAARHFGISKSTVHKDLSYRLPRYNKHLYRQVREVLEQNRFNIHMEQGERTFSFVILGFSFIVSLSFIEILCKSRCGISKCIY